MPFCGGESTLRAAVWRGARSAESEMSEWVAAVDAPYSFRVSSCRMERARRRHVGPNVSCGGLRRLSEVVVDLSEERLSWCRVSAPGGLLMSSACLGETVNGKMRRPPGPRHSLCVWQRCQNTPLSFGCHACHVPVTHLSCVCHAFGLPLQRVHLSGGLPVTSFGSGRRQRAPAEEKMSGVSAAAASPACQRCSSFHFQ